MSEKNQENPLTIRHWLLQTVITSSVVCVGILALGALFLPDGITQLGSSPAINADQEYHDTQKLHERLTSLEQQLQQSMKKSAAAVAQTDLVATEDTAEKLERTTQATQEYEARLQAMQEESLRESRIARMILGMNQLKASYENDASLQSGIDLLKSTIEDAKLQEQIAKLDTLAQEKLPTKQEILTYIHALQDTPTAPEQTAQNTSAAADTATDNTGGWMHSLKDRAQNKLGQLIQVRPTADVQQGKILDRIAQAVHVSDYSLAAELSNALPSNPNTQLLSTKLNARAKAQSLIRGISSGITNTVSNPNTRGALY